MGRRSDPREWEPKDQRIYDRLVPMTGLGDYDRGGAYWGAAAPLRVRFTADGSYRHFYRGERL